jgi:acetolactate synthase-1/2/3 large subunit
MKVSDYISKFLKDKGVDLVFAITGSGSIRLIQSVSDAGINYVCPHIEQAGIMASLTYMRSSNKPAVMMVTGGPGATNTIIALADAYLDSLPLFVFAGQENSEYVNPPNQMRGKGVQGLDMVNVTKPLTKYSTMLTNPNDIRYILEKAFYEAYSGRPGPVWIDIPQDLQWAQVDPEKLDGFVPPQLPSIDMTAQATATIELIKNAKRPLLWVGHGIRLSGAEQKFRKLLDTLGVPALVTWQAADLVPDDHPLFVGRAGTYGQRFANLALQNCDLLITLGTRVALPQRGFNDQYFARAAKKVIVEIDPVELAKFKFNIDIPVLGNVADFIDAMSTELNKTTVDHTQFDSWKQIYKRWQTKYPMATLPSDLDEEGINSYWFIEQLSKYLEKDHVIVTDMGTSLTCTHAGIKLKEGQRIMTSTGLGEMGFGLPGAIGAKLGYPDRPVVLIVGEGSLMMNLQELQTMKNLGLDIKIFIVNNNGYLTIKHTHNALYKSNGEASACGRNSGVTFPDFELVSQAFGFEFTRIKTARNLDQWIHNVLSHTGPLVAEFAMKEFQELIPKSAVKVRPDGTAYSGPLEDLYPFLSTEELAAEMLIPLIKDQ